MLVLARHTASRCGEVPAPVRGEEQEHAFRRHSGTGPNRGNGLQGRERDAEFLGRFAPHRMDRRFRSDHAGAGFFQHGRPGRIEHRCAEQADKQSALPGGIMGQHGHGIATWLKSA